MAEPRFKISVRGNFIQGEFQNAGTGSSTVNGEWVGRSPADFSDQLGVFQYSYAAIDSAVASAKDAFVSWRRRSLAERAAFLRKYQAAIRRREEELAEIIAREVGKPLWEAQSEVTTMINKVDVTIHDSMAVIEDRDLPKIMENTIGRYRYRPHGVMAVIGPFNFPGHLPNGHIVPALLTGNVVIFKPSEKAPLVAQLMAEMFQEAGLPAGVFNLIQGEREVGRRLCVHEGVDGVLFTGSYEVGTRIKQDTLQQHWKILALEMGGKNPAIVWDDADTNLAVHETVVGAFVTAGQRCSATSRIIVQNKVIDSFVEKFHAAAKAFTIGHPLDNPFMGSLVEQGAVDRYMKFLGIASREGCELVMRGKALDLPKKGNYVTPSICWVKEASLEAAKKSIYQQTELFSPNVAIVGVDTLEEAIAQANVTQYGLVASVFSASSAVYEKCWEGLQMGLINWNKATVGASSKLPFGGLKKSGNHFPTALMATRYCTYPVASLETSEARVNPNGYPGLNWKSLD
jgi:succinylglutamic semialdehyde dehydrogenase